MKSLLLFFLFIVIQVFNPLHAQDFKATELVEINGAQYIMHQVLSGETIFSIGKRYNVEQKELVGANPQLIFGLKVGDTLKIPYAVDNKIPSQIENTKQSDNANELFIFHLVKKDDTAYSISKQYGVSIETIYQFNPEARNELLLNEIVRIPKNKNTGSSEGLLREDVDFYYHTIQPGETPYSLSRRYETTVNDIFKLNPEAEKKFDVGIILRIPKRLEEAAQISDSENGNYFKHRIESGDTFYAYSRRFGVSKEHLIELNPVLKEGLKVGLMIKIPAAKIQKIDVIPVDASEFINHSVLLGETLYGISQKYNVGVITIKELNPELRTRGLISGEVLLIPKTNNENSSSSIDEDYRGTDVIPKSLPEVLFEISEPKVRFESRKHKPFSNDTFRIAMFLPLYFDMNERFNTNKKSSREIAVLDSLKRIDRDILKTNFEIRYNNKGIPTDTVLIDSLNVKQYRSLYPNSKYFVNFYQGFLLGLDSMQKAGIKVHLDLYDDQFSQRVVDSLLNNVDLINADLIVGPVDVKLQEKISAFSYKNQIPLVSPLSPVDALLSKNPFYIQVNPSKKYVLKKTSDFIGDAYFDKNFVIMTLGNNDVNEANLANLVRDKFFSSGVYHKIGEVRFAQVDFTEGGNLGYWQVKRSLKPDMENVIFVPATDNRSEREALLSRVINSLHVLSSEFKITLIGLSDYPQFKSINTEYFHKLNLHYLTPHNVNYSSPLTVSFIDKYRWHFKTEPDQYSYRGYDLATYFIGAYGTFGKHFIDHLSEYAPTLTQGDFHFYKVGELSGYMNHTLFIMNFTPQYEVKIISKISEGKAIF